MTFRVSEAEVKCKRGTASKHRKIICYGASQRTPEGPDGRLGKARAPKGARAARRHSATASVAAAFEKPRGAT